MRVVAIVVAVLGVLFLLMVAGCVGCAAWFVSALPERPDHHSAAAISRQYANEIKAAQGLLEQGTVPDVSPIVAVLVNNEGADGFDAYDVVYPDGADTNGHTLINGAGSASVVFANGASGSYPAYKVEAQGRTYVLCFKDWEPAGGSVQSSRSESTKSVGTSVSEGSTESETTNTSESTEASGTSPDF